MSVIRWIFRDSSNGDTVVLPLNPKEMSSPTSQRSMEFSWGTWSNPGSTTGLGRIRAIDQGVQQPAEWTFGGVILTKAHYDLLLEWAQRSAVLQVVDHLQRAFEVVIQRYDPIERLPTKNRPWRADYTMTCLLLRRIPNLPVGGGQALESNQAQGGTTA